MTGNGRIARLLLAAGIALCAVGVLLSIHVASSQAGPTVASASVSGTTLTITFSETLADSSSAVASDFTVKLGEESRAVSSASIDGSAVTLALMEAVPDVDCTDESVKVSYSATDSTLTGSGGGTVAAFEGQAVTNNTDDPPAIESVETDETGRYIYVTFCERISAGQDGFLTIEAFSVFVDGSAQIVNNVLIRSATPRRLEIQLGSKPVIEEGDAVTLAYDSGEADDGDPPQDSDQGNKLVESWSARTVSNNVDSPPSLVSVTALWDKITLTYSEALNESSVPDKSAFRISDTPYKVEITEVDVSGKTVTLTTSFVIRADLSTEFQLRYKAPEASPLQQADGAKDAADFSGQNVVSSTPTSKPVFESAAVDGATLTITFDLPLKAVAPASAFSVGGVTGTSVSSTGYDDKTVTLTLSAAVMAGHTVTISYTKPSSSPRIEARNLTDADSFSAKPVTNNTVAPAPAFSSATTNAAGDTLTITMSMNLLATTAGTPAAGAFTVSGGSAAIAAVAVSGKTVTLTLSPQADASDAITIAYTQPTDATVGRLQSLTGGHLVGSWTAQTVTNNADGKPRPVSAAVDGSSLRITFDRVLDAASKPAVSAFRLGGTSVAVSSVGISGSTATLTLSAGVAYNDTVTADYAKPDSGGFKRSGKDLFAEGFSALGVTNNTPNPRPAFVSAAINAAGDQLTITMSKNLLTTAAGTPDKSAFSIAGGSAGVASVVMSGKSVTLALSPLADVGDTITVAYSQPTESGAGRLQSQSGGHLVETWSAQSAANHADGVPRLVSATVNGDSMALRFDRALDEDAKPPTGDFSIAPTEISVSEVSIDDEEVTLRLSKAVAHDDAVTVSYSASDGVKLKRDGFALTVGAFRGFEVKNNTPEPLLRSVVGDETTILLAFTKTLDTTVMPEATAFSLGSDQPTVTAVTVARTTVTLTLDGALKEGAEYTLTYTVPTTTPLTTSDSSAVPAFSESVTNNTDVAPSALLATGDGSAVSLEFDQSLDSGSAVAGNLFSITAESEVSVSAVLFDDDSLDLTLSRALAEDEAASIMYSQPAQDGVADIAGNRTDSFTVMIDNQTDTAPVPVSGVIEEDTITILLDQELYADPRFSPLEEGSVVYDHFTLTGTDADVTEIEISNGGPGGVGKIVLTLSEEVNEGDSITIHYFPNSGNIPIRDDDAGQNRAEINNYPLENLNDKPPVVESAVVDGKELVVTFDQELDADSAPGVTAFSLSNDGPTVSSISIEDEVLTLTLASTAIEDAEYSLSYTAPRTAGLSDDSGNVVAAFVQVVDNQTDYEPSLVSVTTDVSGTYIHLLFDQRLDPSGTIDKSWFTAVPPIEVSGIEIDPDVPGDLQLRITLEKPIREGATVMLTYTPAASGGLRDDDAGNLVESFSGEVDNLVDVAPAVEQATVDRDILTIEFDQELNPDHIPPANCDEFETPEKRAACYEDPDILWFEVFRDGTEALEVKSVTLSGSTVTILLAARVAKTDEIRVGYSRKSLEGSRFNLRDTSSPGNHVETFDPLLVSNLTAAAALRADLVRVESGRISVEFDAELAGDGPEIASMISVLVGGVSVPVQSARANGSRLDLRLLNQIPECANVSIAYAPGESPLLDADARQVVSFELEVVNLIDAVWGLKCVHSDFGGLVWAFDESGVPDRMGFEWSLSVNGAARTVEVEAADPVIRLVPAESICQGDSIEVRYSSLDESDALVLVRTISHAAPCVISAVADGVTLTVTFDSPLDGAMPDVADFSVGGAVVEAVDGISGGVLTLRLTGPGIRAGQTAALTYSGSRLMGSGLTVGAFVVEISDLTAAPELTSALGINSSIFLNFDQPLIPRSVPASRFIVSIPGIELEVKSVSVSGSSMYLELSESLPDDPDLFGLIYLARDRGGLAGLTGARVENSVFIVQNYTETPPSVLSAVADALQLTVTFDQRVEANGALPSDFMVIAGRRTIAVELLGWSSSGVTLTLAEQVTSLDAVALLYSPGEGREVRDSSKNPLAEFQFWAENETPKPQTLQEQVDDARLRASGETSLERELARGFAADDGIRFGLDGSEGRRTVVRGDLRVTVDMGQGDGGSARVQVARIDEHEVMLAHVESTPASCWDAEDASSSAAWWIGVSDRRGVPSDLSLRISMAGIGRGFQPRSACVLDLKSGEWSFLGADGRVTGPALLLTREAPPTFSWDRLPLAG